MYTAITFAPVQGFIEKSRKLRDLYGSSFILSYLARSLCEAAAAAGHRVVSPALIDVTQGTPNQIVIAGDFAQGLAQASFNQAWQAIVQGCRQWLEAQLGANPYTWKSDWDRWGQYAWEFFWAQGSTITAARQQLNGVKQGRDWTGINWMGESSTLSGVDAIAWPGMGRADGWRHPQRVDEAIRAFSQQLQQLPALGEAFIEASEQLSIPELIKRLMTYPALANRLPQLAELPLPPVETPAQFRRLSEATQYRGWFQGDGDRIGAHLQALTASGQSEEDALHDFSWAMLTWGSQLQAGVPQGRVIYAGGDDFLGVFYGDGAPLTAPDCLAWLYQFPALWQRHGLPITASVGFVWAAPGVPQREVLQHCRLAEQSAKARGRDRVALRILANGGNAVEWVCPWHALEPLVTGYRDREGQRGVEANWGHLCGDVATLQARHAFAGNQSEVAAALFERYFPDQPDWLRDAQHWWNQDDAQGRRVFSGLLGERQQFTRDRTPTGPLDDAAVAQALNHWVSQLATVGFRLCA